MIYIHYLTIVLLILIVSSSLINVGQSAESGNWLTKSLDYYSLEKCSPLDKSGIAGDFYACLNSPVDSSSSTGSTSPPSGQGKSGSGNWGQFNSNGAPGAGGGGVGGFGSSGSFSGQSSFIKSSEPKKSQTSGDSWPLSLVDDLQHMINCFPKLMKPCMIESEVQFFNTIKDFFQSQVNYASPNASLIATRIASSGCAQRNSIDTNTICYSTNIHKQNWFGWKINWIDGQMCHFIDDISKCEASSFDKCPSDVRQFVDGLWKAGLKVTPCLGESTTSMSTTLSSPLPVTTTHVDQTKLLAPGSSVDKIDSNQSPSRLTNVTNINSNDHQNLEVTVNKLTVNNNPNVVPQKQKDIFRSPPLVTSRPYRQFSGKMNDNNVFDGFDQNQQLDVDYDNENENVDFDEGFEVDDEKTKDFKGAMKHSKLVRLHEVEGEGESRHDHDKKHKDVAEEQWSRIKEEFRRKMRESIESRESDESEYEEESEESDEDKNLEIFENRKNPFGPRQRNEEDDYKGNRNYYNNNMLQRKQTSEQEKERQRKRKELESKRRREEEEEEEKRNKQFGEKTSKRRKEIEERMRETEKRRLEEEERRREDGQRRLEEDQRRREEIERNWERKREDARRMGGETKGREDHEKIFRQQPWIFPGKSWENNNNQRNHGNEKGSHSDQYESRTRDCFESLINSWSSHNHNSDDIMDLMCRNMDSLHSCLDKHSANKSSGQANGLGHLKMVHQALCGVNNRPKDEKNIEKVRQCLTDHSPSSRSISQTKYPDKSFSRFWN